ncbi:MAG: type II toxin-antitoxin system VapC family toxin [Pirellulales bacterium]|nr:type II toxin-antitoxin system VapC family toxin [Pirellulales bacterium]
MERKAGKGNPDAAERRLSALRGLPRLAVNEQVEQLAEQLISRRALPETAVEDALHIAIAAVHRVDYLLTWNCRHIDNAETKPAIRAVCIALEYPCPEICAPEELMGGLSDE